MKLLNNYTFWLITLVFFTVVFTSCEEDTIEPEEFGVITGMVTDFETNTPLENARITTSPISEIVFSDVNGEFTLNNVPTGNISVEARLDGYETNVEPVFVVQEEVSNVVFQMVDDNFNNQPPSTPNLISPENGATDVSRFIDLVWNSSVDPDDDPIEYELTYFAEGSADFEVISGLTDTTFTLEFLEYNTRYYWQVAAMDDINEEKSVSDLFSFLTESFPDNRIYYTREIDGNFAIFSASGDPDNPQVTQITSIQNNSFRPRQNPTIEKIACLWNVGSETHIFTMNPDGSEITQITDIPITGFRQSEIDFSWSASGDKIIYPNLDRLFSINLDGTGTELLYTTPNGKLISEAAWSTDESFLALKVNNNVGYDAEIYTIDMAGNPLDTLLINQPGAAGGLDISFDDTEILYTYDLSGAENSNYRQLNTHIFSYNVANGTTIDVSGDKPAGFNDLDPRFSPNDAQVICTFTSNDGVSTRFIYTIDIDDNTEREEIISDGFMPDWQ